MGLKYPRMQRLGYFAALGPIIFGIMAASCDDTETNPAPPSCGSNQAQIAVYDGMLEILCGCQEAAGILIAEPNPLTCTVPSGTTVFFFYQGTKLRHQIISTTNPSLFVNSPVSDPNATIPVRSFYVTFSSTGTYEFQDEFESALNGQIIVQ